MQNLAPEIPRQRLIVEGTRQTAFTAELISEYLAKLGVVLEMQALNEPVTHLSEKFGWSGWMHWATSGVHFYAWDKRTPVFFSVDIYTCKPFDPQKAADFTSLFFDANVVVWKEVHV